MRIDWFTLIAQVLNFLVLVWLLKRLLYGRIIAAMNEREARIAARLDEAARHRAAAEQEAETYRTKNRDFDARREQMLAQAKEQVENQRQTLLQDARAEVDRTRAQWLEALAREKRELLEDFRDRLGRQIFGIARQALKVLANAELERRIVEGFLRHLAEVQAEERQALVEAVEKSGRELEVVSAFRLDAEVRGHLHEGLRHWLGNDMKLRFATDAALVCGIELRAHSHRLVWNADSFISGLEEGLFAGLANRANENGAPVDRAGA